MVKKNHSIFAMADETFADWCRGHSTALLESAAEYDVRTLENRKTANRLELLMAICTVVIGTGGVAGLFMTAWDDLTYAAGATTVVQLLTAFVSAYLQVYRPRQKETAYSNASASNAAIARAANYAADMDSPSESTIKGIIHSLEASFSDDNPLIDKAKTA
jgi:hypothetical protein